MPDHNESRTLVDGQQFAHYQILERLGMGGMGEVYLASDTRLGRKLALKILPAAISGNPETVLRFEQEARASSALNHPHIAHIYEIGETQGLRYIAMEFVDGISLSDKIDRRPLAPAEVVDLAIQIADAMDEAHSHGIIHRDIKSSNIMLDRRGRVKVLDFGLAKILQDAASEESTRLKTKSGVVMGTVSYMSPEQALGRDTDAGTDIWSLGVVMYEMATGRLPFHSESMTETIEQIVHSTPEAIARFNYDVPAELEMVIKKALRKRKDERYRTAGDLLVDLRAIARELHIPEDSLRPEKSTEVSGRASASAVHSTDRNAAETLVYERGNTADNDSVTRSTSGADLITGEIKRHKFAAAGVAVIILAVLAAAGYGTYRILSADVPANEGGGVTREVARAKVQQLTGDGTTTEAAISPDGRFMAFEKADRGERSLWVKQISTNSNVQLVGPDVLSDFDLLQFSPDGSFVYFTTYLGQNPAVYRVPTLGGTPTKVLDAAINSVFSPDGTQLAFIRADSSAAESSIFTASPDGTGERRIISKTGHEWVTALLDWSPDGRSIAVVTGDDRRVDKWLVVSVVSVEDGAITQVGDTAWEGIEGVVWRPDTSGIIVAGYERMGRPAVISELSYPTGTLRALLEIRAKAHGLTITDDGNKLVFVEEESNSGILVSPNQELKNAVAITPAKSDTWGISWTPDNRIVFVDNSTGNREIWSINADGSDRKQLTNDASVKIEPVVSPDGRFIVYNVAQGGGHIWRVNMDGTGAVQLTNGIDESNADISPDGKWVVYSAWNDTTLKLWRVPLEGGTAEKVSDVLATEPRYSPDGKTIACFLVKQIVVNEIGLIDPETGELLKTLPVPPNVNTTVGLVWTPDGKAITYIERQGTGTKLWLHPVDGGPATVLSDDKEMGIYRREWSRDGKRIAITRGDNTSNALVMTDF